MVLIEVDESKGIYKCKLCGKEYKSFYELDSHMMFGHRVDVENEFNRVQGLPETPKEEVEKYLKKSETILEVEDVRNIYKEGPYILKINNDTILRGRSWKDLFEGFIKYFYQFIKDTKSIMPQLYNEFKQLYEQLGFDSGAWREFFLAMANQDGFKISNPNRYNELFEYLRQKGFIEDYYCEKNKKKRGSKG